ncbi:MAG TPA: alpha/beta hydrolase-fold protein [Planctomycetota bacterium]|nr:alpha/beta hydrolase-fold protein [Planctomycetota bacterium]
MRERDTIRAIALATALLAGLTGCTGGAGSSSRSSASAATGGSSGGSGSGGSTGASSGSSTGSGSSSGSSTGSSTGSGSGASAPTAFERFATLRQQVAGLATAQQQAQLDAFIAAQAATDEGFPLRFGTRAAFVWEGTPQGAPVVAGDFDAWNQSSLTLARIGQTTVWFAEATLGADRYEYKLIVDGSWTADPLNRKFSYNYGNSVANMAGSGKSHLEKLAGFRSATLGNARDVLCYFPAGYLDEAPARYPVIYMHDGQNLFDPGAFYGGWGVDATLDGLIAQGAVKKVIVIGPANTPDRMSEYTHCQDDLSSRCDGSQVTGGKAALYADFLVNELKPAIDARYRTLTGRDDTAVIGSSLGGLVSLWIAYAHPGFARNVGGMSSTFDWGAFCPHSPPRQTMQDIVAAAGKQSFAIYLDSGGSASGGGDNYQTTVDLRDLLLSQGFQYNADLSYYWDPNGTHDEADWRARFDKPVRFWFHK